MLFSPRIAAFCLAALWLGACQKEEPPRSTQAPPPTATPNPADHDPIQQQLNAMAEAMPADLQIGSGDDALTVRRHWRRHDTLQRKFGLGWGDDNVIQLVQFDRDAVLIYRGGTGWRLAHRDGTTFKTVGAEAIERGPNGWTYRSNDKTRFEFDEAGRLQKETTPSNKVRNYSYDGSGRLDRVTNTQSESIQYKYDPAGLVASVQGSNNKSTTYSYENGKLSEAKDTTGLSRSYRYQYDAAGAVIAQVRIVGAVPAASANAQTIAVGVETVVAPVAPTATSAALSNLIRATGVIGTSALTAIAVTYAGIEAKGWVEAKTEASAAQATAKSLKNALENKLAEVLQSDPTKLLPFPDGRKPDPKNPDDLEQLLIELHSNLTKEKKPFEGIVVTSPDPSELEAALERARQIIGQTRQARGNAFAAMGRVAELDGEAAGEVKRVVKLWNLSARPGALERLLQSVESVKTSTAQVQAATPLLAALAAELRSAIARCEQMASEACAAAATSPASTADATAQQEKLAGLIKQAAAQVGAQKEKIEQADLVAGETLRDELAELLTLADQISAAIGIAQGKEWLEATERVRDLATQRERVAAEEKTGWEFIQANERELNSVLAPFRTSPVAIALTSEMEGLAINLVDAEPDWLPAGSYLKMLQTSQDQARQAEKALSAANVDALSVTATAVIEQMTKARDALVALATDTRGDQALTRANACLAQIQSATNSVAQASPTFGPSAGAEDEVTVPNLSVFESVLEMKAGLANLGLNGALVAATDKPPSKEKEFKFAGQDPGPGTKVKRGSTVSIAFYQKFEAAPTSSEPFVGTWVAGSHSAKLTVNIRKEGEKYIVIPSVNLGKGTITGESLEGVVRDGKLFARRENWTGVTKVQTGAGKKGNITKGKEEELPPEKVGTSTDVFEQIGVDLRETHEELDKNGKLKSHEVTILHRQ